MPETTAGGIQYPIAGDFIKQDSIEAKLANDMRDLAQTADNAIQVAAEAAEWTKPDATGTTANALTTSGVRPVSSAVAAAMANLPPLTGAGSIEAIPNGGSGVSQVWRSNNGYNEPRILHRAGASNGAFPGPWVSLTDIPEPVTEGAPLASYTTPGNYGTPSAATAATVPDMPSGVAGQPFHLRVTADRTGLTSYRGVRWLTVLPYATGQAPRGFRQNFTQAGVDHDWIEEVLDEPERSPHHRELMLERARTRHGGRIGTGGKGVVVITIDHAFDRFESKLMAKVIDHQLPITLVPSPSDFGGLGNETMTFAKLQSWAIQYGWEIVNHSRDHGDAVADSLIRDKILGSLEALHAGCPLVTIDGYVMPGVGATGYNGFDAGADLSQWWSHIAGRTILDNHAVVSSVTPGYVVPLSGAPVTAMTRLGVDITSWAGLAEDMVVEAGALGGMVNIYGHPIRLDQEGYISSERWGQMLDFIAAERDAGRVEVLTMGAAAWADAGSSHVVNLAKSAAWVSGSATIDLSRAYAWARGSTWELSVDSAAAVTLSASDDTGALNISRTITPNGGRARLGFSIPAASSSLTVSASGGDGPTVKPV